MELKKNPKVDVNRLRIVLLEIGLIVALLVVIAAFLYTPREVTVEKIDMNYGPVEEQITEITRQDQKPPEPPKKTEITVITDILNIVTNDTKISTEVDFAEFEEDVEIIQHGEVAICGRKPSNVPNVWILYIKEFIYIKRMLMRLF